MKFLAEIKAPSFLHSLWRDDNRKSVVFHGVRFAYVNKRYVSDGAVPASVVPVFLASPYVSLSVAGVLPEKAENIAASTVGNAESGVSSVNQAQEAVPSQDTAEIEPSTKNRGRPPKNRE